MGFSNLYSYEIGGVGVFVFLHIGFSLLIFKSGYIGKLTFFPIGEFLGVVHTYSFSEGESAKAAFLTPSERESLRSIHKNDNL